MASLAAVLLVVSSCGGDDGEDAVHIDPSPTPAAIQPVENTDDQSYGVGNGDEAAPDDDTAEPPPDLEVVTIGRIALSATGIGDRVGSFSDNADAVLLEIAAEMNSAGIGGLEGSPSRDSGYYVEENETSSCYGLEVRKVTWDDFSVILGREEVGTLETFTDETFAGWVLGDNDGVPTGLTSPEGVGIGTPSSIVEQVYGPGAFGDEGIARQLFATSDELPAMRGITDAPYPDGGVTILGAGTTCLGIAI